MQIYGKDFALQIVMQKLFTFRGLRLIFMGGKGNADATCVRF